MQNFRQLIVWKKSHELVLKLYRATSGPSDRRYRGLAAQIRRAATSIPANIAEGCGQEGSRELARYLRISFASAFELHYHLQLASDLGLLSPSEFARLDARTEQVKRMLTGLLTRIRHDTRKREGCKV